MSEKSVYEKLGEKIMVPGSVRIPKLFAMLVDEKEAAMLLALPATAPELAAKVGITTEEAAKKLAEFYHKGLAFKSVKPDGVRYRMDRDIVQFHDATILWAEAPRAYFELWQEFMETEWPAYAKIVESAIPKPFTRIIPVEQSLEARNRVLSFESARELIETADTICVTKCTCRLIAGKCDKPVEVCLQIGKAADYNIDRGTGRQISRDEALQILKDSEDAGLMHVTMNKSSDMHFICNCCGCCCIAMPVMIQYGTRMTDPSRYLAKIDADTCEACGACVDRCWFSAITVDEEKNAAVINAEKCMGCGVCQVVCPSGALTLVESRPKEFIPAA